MVTVSKYTEDWILGRPRLAQREQASVPHHLIDVREVTESYSAFDFVSEAKKAIEDIQSRGKLAIIAGGTGLYPELVRRLPSRWGNTS